jgi:HD-like signal output (HDOD) protein
MTAIDTYFRNAAVLPTMPELASRLLRSLDRDDLSLNEISNLIARDQSLAVKVLRLANSARFGTERNVSSLRDAANLIGMRGLRDLTLAACMVGMFPQKIAFDRARFWRHGVATAGHARTLATLAGIDPDQAYLAGLLLRTGRILMLLTETDATLRTDALADTPDSLIGHEMTQLGCSHADISAELARRWHFPQTLVDALSAATAPLEAKPFSPLGGLIRLASTLADAGDMDLPELETLLAVHPALVQQLALDPQRMADELMPFEVLTLGVDQLLA